MNLSRNIALVRTQFIDGRTYELTAQLGGIVGSANVFVVVDELETDAIDAERSVSGMPFRVLPMTRMSLDHLGIDYEGKRTGWKCGDYVLYRALSEDWRNAWVVEPDVHFLNGSEEILSEASVGDDVDLACLNFRHDTSDWFWADSFREWVPGPDVASMAFPIFRISRPLVEFALRIRQDIRRRSLNTTRERPNDESIVASAAKDGKFNVMDLRDGRKSWFDYFSTVIKYHAPSLMSSRFDPLVVHSAVSSTDMIKYARAEVGKIVNGDRTSLSRLKAASARLSPELLRDVFEETLDEVCKTARERRGLH